MHRGWMLLTCHKDGVPAKEGWDAEPPGPAAANGASRWTPKAQEWSRALVRDLAFLVQ